MAAAARGAAFMPAAARSRSSVPRQLRPRSNPTTPSAAAAAAGKPGAGMAAMLRGPDCMSGGVARSTCRSPCPRPSSRPTLPRAVRPDREAARTVPRGTPRGPGSTPAAVRSPYTSIPATTPSARTGQPPSPAASGATPRGPGLYASSGTLSLAGDTLSANVAVGGSGNNGGKGQGGGLFVVDKSARPVAEHRLVQRRLRRPPLGMQRLGVGGIGGAGQGGGIYAGGGPSSLPATRSIQTSRRGRLGGPGSHGIGGAGGVRRGAVCTRAGARSRSPRAATRSRPTSPTRAVAAREAATARAAWPGGPANMSREVRSSFCPHTTGPGNMEEELAAAVDDHRRGLLDRAMLVYERVLAPTPIMRRPEPARRIVRHQTGDHIRRSASSAGRSHGTRTSLVHANLAEAYRALGQYERAVECCQSALRLSPILGCPQQPGPCPPVARPDGGSGRPVPRGDRAPALLRDGPQQPGPCPAATGRPGPGPRSLPKAVELDPTGQGALQPRPLLLSVTAVRKPSTTVSRPCGSGPISPRPETTWATSSASWAGWPRRRPATPRRSSSTPAWPSPTTTWARPCRKRARSTRPCNGIGRPGAGAELGPIHSNLASLLEERGVIGRRSLTTKPRSGSTRGFPRRTMAWAGPCTTGDSLRRHGSLPGGACGSARLRPGPR